jgi:hypothetical protein
MLWGYTQRIHHFLTVCGVHLDDRAVVVTQKSQIIENTKVSRVQFMDYLN